MPVAGELPPVAPVNDHVLMVTPQLSEEPGLVIVNVVEQLPVPSSLVLAVTLAAQVIIGAVLSITVTVKLHVD